MRKERSDLTNIYYENNLYNSDSMFYTVGNKWCKNIKAAKIMAYKLVKSTGKSVDINKVTAKRTVDYANVNNIKGKIYYTPYGGSAVRLYADGTTKE